MKSRKAAFIIIFIFFLKFYSCNDDSIDPVKLQVVCGGEFEGYYIFNDNNPVGFGGSSDENPYIQTGSSYYYIQIFEDLDTLYVNASRYDNTDSLKIFIYRDNNKVKEVVLSAEDADDSSPIYDLEIEYTYGEEDISTTDTDTDS